MPPDLSDAQKVILDPTIRVVEAGPGSGKTRALVARFMHEAASNVGGVALVSFTNVAVEEARRRAGADRSMLRAPHFVGTIDAFLHRFIVTPTLAPRLGRQPTYLASWRDLPEHYRTTLILKGVPGAGIGLDKFIPVGNGIALAESSLNRTENHYLSEVDQAGLRQKLVNWATQRICAFNERGVYDASTARAVAYKTLTGSLGPRIIERLGIRFELILVDEAQDCDAAEMGVFGLLATQVPSVLVADPDQAIYEFRGGGPQLFVAYRDAQEKTSQARLAVNHRSSSSICRAITALRAAGVGRIEAADEADCAPVLVIGGTKGEQRTKFRAVLAEYDIVSRHGMVLAHAGNAAAAVAGQPPPKSSIAAGNRLAAICSVLARAESSPSERLRAITDTERILLSLIDWDAGDAKSSSREEQLESLDRSAAWLRAAAGTVIAGLKDVTDADEFGKTARDLVKNALGDLPSAHAPLGAKIKKPDASAWAHRTADTGDDVLSYDTVHGCKGREFPAVLLALYDLRKVGGRDVLDDWRDRRNTEARRVLYVGASRAQRVLAFGGTEQTAQRVRVLLEAAHVPVRSL